MNTEAIKTLNETKTRTQEVVAADWLAAKRLVGEAVAMQLAIEVELLKLIPAKPEGSSTHNINGFKIELKGTVNRKVDWAIFDKIVADLKSEDPDFPVPEKQVRSLDETGVRWLQQNNSAAYLRLSPSITAKPGKTGVSIVRTE